MTEEATNVAYEEGKKEGKAAERTRISAILNSPESKGRRELAMHMALHTNMTPEDVSSIMGMSPRYSPLFH